jgi:broad specificity phosphatase PhoE
VSDLFCPATLIVARHGQATYDELGIASDDGGWLTDLGRRQAAALADELADRRLAAVWCSDMSRAVQTAEIVAGRLGVPVRVRRDLREASVGGFAGQPDVEGLFDSVFLRWLDGDLAAAAPSAETGQEVIDRVSAELESAADQFRGETLLVVSHGGAIGITLPRLAGNVPADYGRGKALGNCDYCELVADADGWVLRSWAGLPV